MAEKVLSAEEVEDLKRRVAAHPFWYHHIKLPGGIVTPGVNPLNTDVYRVPADLTGKRVLDVGAWDGYWTFLALQRGAREVVAIDDFSDYMGFLQPSQRHAWATFDLCREALGYDETRCTREEISVYDVTQERFGRFDIIFFFGTLYHLRHPLLALDKLSAICNEQIYVESAICDDHSPYRGGLGHGYPGGQVVMEFYPNDQLAGNNSNWWSPTLHCLAAMVLASGFAKAQAWKLLDNPAQLGFCRGFTIGTKTAAHVPPATSGK
jgi:tRNA (mo5U34)-methyltransferase